MFLGSFEKLRYSLLNKKEIVNMIHLGARAFESIGGEVVQTTAFVMRTTTIGENGVFFRLVDSVNKERDFLNEINKGENGDE